MFTAWRRSAWDTSAQSATHFSVTDGHHRLSLALGSGGARSSGGAERMNTWWLYGLTVPGAAGNSSLHSCTAAACSCRSGPQQRRWQVAVCHAPHVKPSFEATAKG